MPNDWLQAMTIPVPETGCMLWLGTWSKGYGVIGHKVDGKSRNKLAHREAFASVNGPIPEGLVVRHKCDTPACCNPDHLEIGTQAQNLSDMRSRGRSNYRNRPKGEDTRTVLTNEQAIAIFKAEGSQRSIGKRFGISQSAVHFIKTGKTWSSITGYEELQRA